MKQTPALDRAQKLMQPGHLSREGFLGDDKRLLVDIIQEDNERVGNLGLSHEQIAERLQYFTDKAKEYFENPVTVDEIFELCSRDARGKLGCPWPHPGLYRKTLIYLKRTDTGETLEWSELTIHMIKEHGFYQGKGSHFRLEPAELKRILDL